MRILLLLAQYYPIRNPNVYRWSAIAEYWVQQGHEVHVLCTRRAGVPEESVQNGVQVHQSGQATLLDWIYNVLKIKARRGEVNAVNPAKAGWARKILEKIIDCTWRNFYWPDGSCLWYLPGKKRALQLQERHDFQVVISVSLPFTANLIARAVKKKYPDLRWLMDIEDPFAISEEFWVNNFKLYRHKNFRAEAAALWQADRISVTVNTAKKLYIQAFPTLNLQEKIVITPPVVNVNQKIYNNPFLKFNKSKINIAYFGTFYERVRTPEAFLIIITALFKDFPHWQDRLQIHFFGEIPIKIWSTFNNYKALNPNLIFHGLVNRETVAAAMQAADFLLNIGNTTNYHLPSKSAEYLMSGKPIINICQTEDDTFAAFLQQYPLICNIYSNNKALENAMLFSTFIKRNVQKQVSKEILERLATPYQLESIANAYFQLLTKS